MTPDYQIIVGGQNVTELIREHFVSFEHVDGRGVESDSFEFTITDPGNNWSLPIKGRELEFSCGFTHFPLVYRGRFKVDEVAVEGGVAEHDCIVVRCKAADMRSTMKSQKNRSWNKVSLSAVLSEVAANHGLVLRASGSLSSVDVAHLDQVNESDMNLLTRLGKQFNAVAKIADGHLLFVAKGGAKSASGVSLSSVTIDRRQTGAFSFLAADRTQYTGVKGYWRDYVAGVKKSAVVGGAASLKTLRTVFKTEAECRASINAALASIQQGGQTMSFDLADAVPELFASMPLRLAGWRDEIAGDGWEVDTVTTILDERLWQSVEATRNQ